MENIKTNRFINVYEKIIKNNAVITGICIMIMIFTIVPDALGRKFLGQPLPGTLEINEMLMVIIVFMGQAWTQREKGHVKCEVITSRLPEKIGGIVNLIIWFLSFLFFSLLTIATATEAYYSFEMRETVWGVARLPIWPIKMLLVFGLGMLCIQMFLDFLTGCKELFLQSKNSTTKK